MARIRRLWAPVLLAALVAVLIGPGVVTAAEPRATTGKIMIPAAAFVPTSGDWDYLVANHVAGLAPTGLYLRVNSGGGSFVAPLDFPTQTVKIRKVTLYASDNGYGYICATLHRAEPATAAVDAPLGEVCTVDSASSPQVVSTTAIAPRQVNTAVTGPYLWVDISAPGLTLYGVAILYGY